MTRLNHYLTEDQIGTDQHLVQTIKDECGPFIQMCKESNTFYYRGMKIGSYIFRKMRQDRNPMNTSPWLHKYMNELFKKKFGWPVRDGVFAAKSLDFAEGYGTAHAIFGKGDFEYCWSPRIKDLFHAFNDTITQINFGFGREGLWFEYKEKLSMSMKEMEYLQKLADSYIDTHIQNAHKLTEISFYFPNGYYTIHDKNDIDMLVKEFI